MAFDNSLANFHNRNVPIQSEGIVPKDELRYDDLKHAMNESEMIN